MPTSVPLTAMQRVGEAGILLPPEYGAVTGWGALVWRGARWFSGLAGDGKSPLPVPLAIPRRLIRPQDGLVLCNERWSIREIVVDDGLRLTSDPRSVAFAMRYAPSVWHATVVLDMACFDDLVSVDEVSEWIDRHPSYTGIEQARQARDLADENAWSPREVVARLIVDGARFPEMLTNRPVFDLTGRLIGTPDLIDPASGVAVEYDGPDHLERQALDAVREKDFRTHGLLPVVMVSEDVAATGDFFARLRAAYREAERRPAADRRWTLELPRWWVPTFTVQQRRSLDGAEREVWLGHRRPADDHWQAG